MDKAIKYDQQQGLQPAEDDLRDNKCMAAAAAAALTLTMMPRILLIYKASETLQFQFYIMEKI